MAEYIEREAFIAEREAVYCADCPYRKNSKGKFVYDIGDAPCRACGIRDVLDDAEGYPAADVVPVRHGRWVEVEVKELAYYKMMIASMRCDQCGRYHNEVYHYGDPTEMAKCCGFCGALMDKDGDGDV